MGIDIRAGENRAVRQQFGDARTLCVDMDGGLVGDYRSEIKHNQIRPRSSILE